MFYTWVHHGNFYGCCKWKVTEGWNRGLPLGQNISFLWHRHQRQFPDPELVTVLIMLPYDIFKQDDIRSPSQHKGMLCMLFYYMYMWFEIFHWTVPNGYLKFVEFGIYMYLPLTQEIFFRSFWYLAWISIVLKAFHCIGNLVIIIAVTMWSWFVVIVDTSLW